MDSSCAGDGAVQFLYRGQEVLPEVARQIAAKEAADDLWDAEEFEAYWIRLNDALEDSSERAQCAEVITSITRDELEIFLPE